MLGVSMKRAWLLVCCVGLMLVGCGVKPRPVTQTARNTIDRMIQFCEKKDLKEMDRAVKLAQSQFEQNKGFSDDDMTVVREAKRLCDAGKWEEAVKFLAACTAIKL